MHRIGILSDTHGLLRPEVTETLQTCDVIFHAGDIDRPEILDKLKALKPLYAVRGNADKEWAESLPAELTAELFGYRFYMVHNKKEISADADDADFIIYGHSHKYSHEERDGQIWLNPGSCGRRRFTLPITMAVAEIEEHRCRIIRKEITGEKGVSLNGGSIDQASAVRAVIREFDRGRSVENIAAKCGISHELTEQICRMYSTHPGIDVDGILNRITK